MGKTRQAARLILLLLAVATAGCSGDLAGDDSQVLVTASALPRRSQVDISGDQEDGYVDLQVRNIPKNTATTNTTFLAVRLDRYRVTYLRADGGKAVPQGFVSALPSTTVEPGGTVTIPNLQILNPNAFSQAPFAALLAQNGGTDPETGNRFVKLTAVIEVFGETLAGENVTASVQVPFTFCNGCGNIFP